MIFRVTPSDFREGPCWVEFQDTRIRWTPISSWSSLDLALQAMNEFVRLFQ